MEFATLKAVDGPKTQLRALSIPTQSKSSETTECC